MGKVFHCSWVTGEACEFFAADPDVEEVVRRALEHAKSAHKEKDMRDLERMVRSVIRDE